MASPAVSAQDISRTIQDRRHELGISLKKLSLLAGVSEPTLIRIEHGHSVRTENLIPVLQALGLRLAAVPE
jgi:transcriptional regulator with XRE-family HTH domain